jgi:hypothetical protein
MCTDGKNGKGRKIEVNALEEIERSGLTGLVSAKFLEARGVIRIGRPGPDGVPLGGIDYPVDIGFPTIREHLRLYRKLKDAWE